MVDEIKRAEEYADNYLALGNRDPEMAKHALKLLQDAMSKVEKDYRSVAATKGPADLRLVMPLIVKKQDDLIRM